MSDAGIAHGSMPQSELKQDGALTPMLSEDGSPFSETVLAQMEALLVSQTDADRAAFRDRNAQAIATALVPRLLIVAGPGTGKSFLFLLRIRAWIDQNADREIYVASFVRKLVKDLDSDIKTSNLSEAEQALVTVTTLHGVGRQNAIRVHAARA